MALTRENLNRLENTARLIRANQFNELNEFLLQQKTKLTGHSWDYFYPNQLIEKAARDAILAGHEDIVRLLLDAGLHPNTRIDYNFYVSPLIYFAVESNKLSMVMLLVEYGAEVCSQREEDDNIDYGFRMALSIGNGEIVNYLQSCGVDIHKFTEAPVQPDDFAFEKGNKFISAAAKGNLQRIKNLFATHLERAANMPNRLTQEAKEALTQQLNPQLLSVENCKINFIRMSSSQVPYSIILPSRKDLSRFMIKLKWFGRKVLSDAVNTIPSNTRKPKWIIIVSNKKYISFQYNDSIDREIVKKKIAKFLERISSLEFIPAIFTNSPADVIEMLIFHQYQKIDKTKTAIMKAIEIARDRNHATVVTFLEEHFDINYQDKDGNSLLHNAVRAKDLEYIKHLVLKKSADVNLQNYAGDTPLSLAARLADIKEEDTLEIYNNIMQFLLEQNADPDKCRDDSESPLALSVEANNIDAVRMLLPTIAKKDIVRGNFFNTEQCRHFPWYVDLMFNALHQKYRTPILFLLKGHGADFNVKNQHGETLLNKAIGPLPSPMAIERELRANRDWSRFQELEKKRKKLLHDPEKYAQKELRMLQFLVSNGANVDATDDRLQTPLHRAASFGNQETVAWLLGEGVDFTAKDKNGHTAMDLITQVLAEPNDREYLWGYSASLSMIESKQEAALERKVEPAETAAVIEPAKRTTRCVSLAKILTYVGLYCERKTENAAESSQVNCRQSWPFYKH